MTSNKPHTLFRVQTEPYLVVIKGPFTSGLQDSLTKLFSSIQSRFYGFHAITNDPRTFLSCRKY